MFLHLKELLRREVTHPRVHTKSVADWNQNLEIHPFSFFRELILYQSLHLLFPSSSSSFFIFLTPHATRLLTSHKRSISYPVYKLKQTRLSLIYYFLNQGMLVTSQGYFLDQNLSCYKF